MATPLDGNCPSAMFWFMRKHGVLPKADLGGSARRSSMSTGEVLKPIPPSKPKQAAKPQREFLHRALLAIGATLEERAEGKDQHVAIIHRSEPLPPRDWPHLHPAPQVRSDGSCVQYQGLRKLYAAHADAECDELEKAVAQRQKEVDSLQKKVKQLEEQVTATRRAIERRKTRLNMKPGASLESSASNRSTLTSAGTRGRGTLGQEETEPPMSAIGAVIRSKNVLMKAAGNTVETAEHIKPEAPRKSVEKKPDIFEELQETMTEQMKEETQQRTELDKKLRQLDAQTVERKSREAGLFNAHGQVLQARATALQAESRAKRLSKELRRVYKSLPQVIQQRIAESSAYRAERRDAELEALRGTNMSNHFKFMDRESLLEKTRESKAREEDLMDRYAVFSEALQGAPSEEAVNTSLTAVMSAINNLREAWEHVAEATNADREGRWSDFITAGATEEATRVLLQADLNVTVLRQVALACTAPTDGAIENSDDGSPVGQ